MLKGTSCLITALLCKHTGREFGMIDNYEEKVYAGILGKIIGVFYGRPIEGWPYEKIKDRFDVVDHFVAEEIGVPLHVADDDLSGTFTFFICG